MGWSSGTRIFSEIIDVLKENVDDSAREVIYEQLIEIFQEADCDNLDECLGEDDVFDDVWKRLYPIEEDWEDSDDGC